ncbi:MAG: dephospho-CoA kinase [Candidatus Choladocola sp.]|nr:dephospho-CoA kinase [Candidatus Choladocola sp.]
MKVLGITGGVGAGKSTILDYMQKMYHARVIQADKVSHMLQEVGQSCYYRIIETFGTGILNGDHTISREKLAAAVFDDYGMLQKLNQIIHPAVKEFIIKEIEEEKRRKRVPFVVIEAALLLEDHYDLICDEIWYVYADEATRRVRLMKSRGYSDAKVRKIMGNQMKDAGYRARCKFVIDNSGNIVENTYEQIDKGLIEHEFL